MSKTIEEIFEGSSVPVTSGWRRRILATCDNKGQFTATDLARTRKWNHCAVGELFKGDSNQIEAHLRGKLGEELIPMGTSFTLAVMHDSTHQAAELLVEIYDYAKEHNIGHKPPTIMQRILWGFS